MVSNDEFNLRRLELVNLYKEYATLLEHLTVQDLNNFRKLDRLSNIHYAVLASQAEFTQFIANTIKQPAE